MDLNDYIEFIKTFIKDEKLNRRKLNSYCRSYHNTYLLDLARQIFLKQTKTIQGIECTIYPIELFDYAFKWDHTYEGFSFWSEINHKFYKKFVKFDEIINEDIWKN